MPSLRAALAAVAFGCCMMGVTLAAHARPVKGWSDAELLAEADLVAIATATESMDEAADRTHAAPDSWVGVNTNFKPSAVLKGEVKGGSFTVRHDRYFDPKMSVRVVDGPGFVVFDTKATTYLLFLKKLDDGRYEAVSGRMDPHFSVRVLTQYVDPPIPAPGVIKGDVAPKVEEGLRRMADPKAFFIESAFAAKLKDLPREQRDEVVARAKALLGANDLEVRRRAALLLGDLGDSSGVPVMIKDFGTSRGHDRDNVAVALRVLKDRRAVPALTQALDDPSPYVRGIALAALGELKAVEAYDKIASHLKDKEQQKNTDILMIPATSACYALGALGERKALPLLVGALDDADLASSATQALAALTKTGDRWTVGQWKAWWAEQNNLQRER